MYFTDSLQTMTTLVSTFCD